MDAAAVHARNPPGDRQPQSNAARLPIARVGAIASAGFVALIAAVAALNLGVE